MYKGIRKWYVRNIYADHNSSKSVKNAIKNLLNEIRPNQIGLNIGAGTTKIHEQVRNLDIFEDPNIDYVGYAENIPETDNFFDLIITQETLEHVQDPFKAVSEMYRVLKTDGKVYCQLPFIIGYHPGPTDFWRFTREGIIELFEKFGFTIIESKIAVGQATGFYRILVEFLSTLLSIPLPFLYHIFKAIFSLILYPIKWLDFIYKFSKQADRIPGGYYVIAQKL